MFKPYDDDDDDDDDDDESFTLLEEDESGRNQGQEISNVESNNVKLSGSLNLVNFV